MDFFYKNSKGDLNMKNEIRRLYVEKKPGFDIEAQHLLHDLKLNLGFVGIKGLRIINIYDICGISKEAYEKARDLILSEKTVDMIYEDELQVKEDSRYFAVEYLPGQYNQRSDSALQCIQILTGYEPVINSSKLIVTEGILSEEDFLKIKNYCINPVDSREGALVKPSSLVEMLERPGDIAAIKGFIGYEEKELESLSRELNLAMSPEDLSFCRDYFKESEKRDPSLTELRVIDTYWSDHCRHTTFLTTIEEAVIEDGKYAEPIAKSYEDYLELKESVYGSEKRETNLMDIAVIGMKELRKKGLLKDLEVSDEINACSIEIEVEIDNKNEKWLLMFKNETHNHPTEIEPYGGAATCLGGAIRDPLSGRAYVYQAMRVTGSGDPRTKISETIPGKLAQRKITIGAAQGYSSYGNQIGLATGQVSELYDEGYVAKRMEIGAVIAAAPKENVVREKPQAGDAVVLIGGQTGRDGCGGATGSSKEHDEDSLLKCGAEVQKGNPVTERKIQRLFRNPKASRLIKKCNDFGAGGVAVAIGELSDGLHINLDLIPKKYEGLDGTELAISESQERMAVIVSRENLQKLLSLCEEENLQAIQVAEVTEDKRLKMIWRGKCIVDISREFLDTNGVRQKVKAVVKAPDEESNYFKGSSKIYGNMQLKEAWLYTLQQLNACSQKGLVERFDSTIGAGTVILPLGGKYQSTPSEGMAAKIPVLRGETNTVSIMTFGCNPKIGKWSPYHGGLYSIVEAAAKLVALGGDYRKIRLSLQEYFEKLGQDAEKWGKPLGAMLGALRAQRELNIAAIGGKDSMSGTFKDLNVPPTVAAFAVSVGKVEHIVSSEFKNHGSKVVILSVPRDSAELPDFKILLENFTRIGELARDSKILSACSVKSGGIAEAISKMCFGNRVGMRFADSIDRDGLFSPDYGSIILEISEEYSLEEIFSGLNYKLLGYTESEEFIEVLGERISLKEVINAYENILEDIFPTRCSSQEQAISKVSFESKTVKSPIIKTAKPRIFIPAFPGTNCEYDSQRAFERAGGVVESFVFRNLTSKAIEQSIEEMVKKIRNSQIIMLPGGFSAGDEPDGSGKFITAVFRNERIKEAVMELLNKRDGLMIGVCNGFQALIKLGLVPYGEIRDLKETAPTLTYNSIGRHVSRMVNTKIVSKLSPWFNNVELGDIHTLPVSHGEGRFVCSEEEIKILIEKGQIAAQYVDFEGNPSNDIEYNPNGSFYAVEAITNEDGRILGKMAHSERVGHGLYKNIPGEKDQRLFEAGVQYYR
jgi:phosphoribosylformylglycinamidine synthase